MVQGAVDRPLASLSLDLDDKWTYLQTRGDPSWSDYPSYLEVVVPRILDFLSERKLRITFFVVGRDAASTENRSLLREIVHRGHEIANHSFRHEPWLHLYSDEELDRELSEAEDAIATISGSRPDGFRGPGFSVSEGVVETLARRGYRYDASTLPNLLNPVARAYFIRRSTLNPEEKERRSALFGSATDAFRPLRPYLWKTASGRVMEIPVTTLPVFRVPIHYSYQVYLGTFSPWAARTYAAFAMGLCRIRGIEPSLLLHPLDFLGEEDEPDLCFFPGMRMARARKLELMDRCLRELTERFRVVTMGEHASAAERGHLPTKSLRIRRS